MSPILRKLRLQAEKSLLFTWVMVVSEQSDITCGDQGIQIRIVHQKARCLILFSEEDM